MLSSVFKNYRPSLYLKNLNNINFSYLKKELKIEYIVIDKDDTFTKHHEENLHSEISKQKIKEMVNLFGSKIFICSNSRRDFKIDYQDKGLNYLINEKNSFRPIVTYHKKPFNSEELLDKMSKLNNNEFIDKKKICVIGDRWMTDNLLGSDLDCFTVLLDCFEDSKRTPDIRFLYFLERLLFVNGLKKNSPLYENYNGIKINKNYLISSEFF